MKWIGLFPNEFNGIPSYIRIFKGKPQRKTTNSLYFCERQGLHAWMDGFRSILTRFDTSVSSWNDWNYLAFAVVSLKKIHKLQMFI